ncbi:MAG: SIS domain-containing protein [Rhodobacteraceae bacterium]|nr:SIS domain-containing protein [Paracoccaceae bacterium]
MDGAAPSNSEFGSFVGEYGQRLAGAMAQMPVATVEKLAATLLECWKTGRQVFLFGNGGSAGNAIHIANDWIYAISKTFGSGLRAHALPANGSTLTCLANDEGYDKIFSYQLAVLAKPGDVAIALSGSGNSPNVVEALQYCKSAGIVSFAILGYSGGKALTLADHPIHFAVDDMQISEDMQLVIGHILMQWLYKHRDRIGPRP